VAESQLSAWQQVSKYVYENVGLSNGQNLVAHGNSFVDEDGQPTLPKALSQGVSYVEQVVSQFVTD
jgi:hypothetical protein